MNIGGNSKQPAALAALERLMNDPDARAQAAEVLEPVYVTQQRWYGAKSRAVSHTEELDAIQLRTTEPYRQMPAISCRSRSNSFASDMISNPSA